MHDKGFPKPNPYLTIFQELFILTGTTYAEGAFFAQNLQSCLRKLWVRLFYFVFLRKITAERLYFSIYSANPLMAGMACLGSFDQ
jgi:hypothetical protein